MKNVYDAHNTCDFKIASKCGFYSQLHYKVRILKLHVDRFGTSLMKAARENAQIKHYNYAPWKSALNST